jgi:tetratricopeptide (TPR) repeat protein
MRTIYCTCAALIRKALTLWLPFLALIASSPALADDALTQPSREEIMQELQLVKMLLNNSPLAERARNNDEKLKQPIELARTLYTRANDAFIAGNLVWAGAFLDEALSVMEDAARLASDPLQVETKQRERYAELLEDVRAFDATYQDVRKGLPPKDVKKYDTEIEPTRSLIHRAQNLMRDSQYLEGSELLEKVHEIYISVLNELLASTAFVYDTNFKSPIEEYEYELARYRSYEELIPIARDQFKPDEYTLKLSERFVQEAKTALGSAEKQAAEGDHPAAIKTLQDATKRLQTALRTIGLEVPG